MMKISSSIIASMANNKKCTRKSQGYIYDRQLGYWRFQQEESNITFYLKSTKHILCLKTGLSKPTYMNTVENVDPHLHPHENTT